MTKLNLDKLKKYRDEILKTEIGALLFNLGKTHIGFWKEKEGNIYFAIDEESFKNIFGFKIFGKYPNYYQNQDEINKSPFEYELEKYNLKNFVENQIVQLPFIVKKEQGKDLKEIKWIELFKGNSSQEEFIKKIFFRGCENINSGIDKGAPNKQLKPPLWLANAFGSLKQKIEEKDFDLRRQCFFQNLFDFLKEKDYFSKPKWQDIRKFIINEINKWYSHLLSDSRFPVNAVSLWDQAYMTASMFKAVLAQLVMDDNLYEIEKHNYFKNPSSIKWRILGIQYDKLGLAEKGFKLASISWYRDAVKQIDNQIKKLLEVQYPIGNEIYRDETGIYFIVGDVLEEDNKKKDNKERDNKEFTTLDESLKEIKEGIYSIFEKELQREIYPTIVLTKASRGLMNLGFLIENAKNNFLKGRKPILNLCLKDSYKGNAIGICPLCKVRLIFEEDKQRNNSPTICEVCDERIHHQRVNIWLNNLKGETIWTDEIKDSNNRMALISLKFELKDWLNGNLLNSFLVRREDYESYLKLLKKLLEIIKNTTSFQSMNYLIQNLSLIENFLKLFDNSLQQIYKGFTKHLNDILQKSYKQIEDEISKINFEISQRNLSQNKLRKKKTKKRKLEFILSLKKKLKSYLEDPRFAIELAYNSDGTFSTNNTRKDNIKNQIIFAFLYELISNTLLERSIGNKWEEFIKSNLSNPNFIDFENKIIVWKNLTDKDIEFLSTLLLQFLLRKNPSPARLRRIWETTQEFLEDIKHQIWEENTLGIPQWRRKRIVFDKKYTEELKGKIKETGQELEGNGLIFWVQPNKEERKVTIYLISSIEEFIGKFGNNDTIRQLKQRKLEDITKDNFKDFEIQLKVYSEKDNKGIEETVLILKKGDIKDFITYKPLASITDPTPVGWQFIVPAEYVPKLIDLVMEQYNKEFKYVYGKLPIHIGIIIQNYKRPLYVGINALRRIRRDVKDTNKLYQSINNFCIKFAQKLSYATPEEYCNDTVSYYSLYWNNPNQKSYNFYIRPSEDSKKWLSTIGEFPKDQFIEVIPNTFDFEFLDTNTRRNDIFYDENRNYKRVFKLKSNRPYEIEEYWSKFKAFKELFKDKANSSKMHRLVNIFYQYLQSYNKDLNPILASAIINVLELRKKKDSEKYIRDIFDLSPNRDIYEELVEKLNEEKLKLFLDMFEFWHKALKEV